ncbi:MAG: hypothetical protein ABIF08_02495 [Nanoarchaeota archaeon]
MNLAAVPAVIIIAGILTLPLLFHSASAQEEDCYHAWSCTKWGECQPDGMQAIECTYSGTCSEEKFKPSETQECEYISPVPEEPEQPESTGPLFDVLLSIPEGYNEIKMGDNFLLSVSLVNFGEPGRIDVLMQYRITDVNDRIILTDRETVAVETQTNIIKEFDLPDGIEAGVYTVRAKISYGENKEAESESLFEVKGEEDSAVISYLSIGIFITGFILSGIVIEGPKIARMFRKKKSKNGKRKNRFKLIDKATK